MQKVKQVGEWKIGDKVWQGLYEAAALTQDYYTIVSFSDDKSRAHLRHSVGNQMQWVGVEELSIYRHGHQYRKDGSVAVEDGTVYASYEAYLSALQNHRRKMV